MNISNPRVKCAAIITTLVCMMSTPAQAENPTLGGPMSHLLITLFQNQVFITYESPSMSVVSMQDNEGTFTGASSVLNNEGYNAQFGWLANGFISLPPSSGIFVRTVAMSEHLSVYQQGSFDPILGTNGSSDIWQWNGTMTHNWYATDVHGTHSARYEVFVGDLFGNPRAGFTSGFIDFNFVYGPDLSDRIDAFSNGSVSTVPAPGALCMLLACSTRGLKRRRRSID